MKKKLHLEIRYFNLMILKIIFGILCDLYVHMPAERIKRPRKKRQIDKRSGKTLDRWQRLIGHR